MRLNEQEKNSFEAIWQLVNFAKLKITATTLKATLLQSRDNNTIATLSDILNEYNVPNMVARLNNEQLNEIPLPAIAFFEGNGGSFATITKIENDTIEWLHNKAGIVQESIVEFSHKWSGIILLIEPNEQSGEANYTIKRKAEFIESLRVPFIILGIALFLGIVIFNLVEIIPLTNNWQFYGLIATKTIGLVISIMLIWHSIDSNNSFLKSVCQINEKTNCNNILNSKAAKIFDWLFWSEIGLFYFAGCFLALLLVGNEAIIPILWFGALAIPYTIWSIYYQGFEAKEWCPLCLAVQALIVIEFILFLKSDIVSFPLENIPWPTIFLSFAIIPILWTAIKKPLQKSMRTDSLYNEFQKMKFDPDYILSFMSKQRILPPIFEGMKVVELGSKNGENKLILVLSLVCNSCSKAYLESIKLILLNKNINIKIIFSTIMNPNDRAWKVTNKLLNLPAEKINNALNEWFLNIKQSEDIWLKTFSNTDEKEKGNNQVMLHYRWLGLVGVTQLPALFLNNVELPKLYKIEDLTKLIQTSNTIGFANQEYK